MGYSNSTACFFSYSLPAKSDLYAVSYELNLVLAIRFARDDGHSFA